jgi:hypothetical protein
MRYPMVIMGLAALIAFDLLVNHGRLSAFLLQPTRWLFT